MTLMITVNHDPNLDPNPILSFRDMTMALMITVNLDPNPNLVVDEVG